MSVFFRRRTLPNIPINVIITGTGNSRYCYINISISSYNAKNYYITTVTNTYYNASNIEVMPGDTIVFGVYGYAAKSYGEVVIDGTQTLKVTDRTTKTYNWTVPDRVKTISINLAYTSTPRRYGRITVTTNNNSNNTDHTGGTT